MRWLPELAQAARFHSHEMAHFDFFDHTTHPTNSVLFDEVAVSDPFVRQGAFLPEDLQVSQAGENIATGSEDPYAVTLSWLRSTDQCATIFGGFDFMGAGYVESTDSSSSSDHFYTQNFVSFALGAPAPARYPLAVGWHTSNHVFGGTGLSFYSQFQSQTRVVRHGVVVVDGVAHDLALEIGTAASGSWFVSLSEDQFTSASCSEYYFLFEDDAGWEWRLPESPAVQYMTFGVSGCTRNSITYTSAPTSIPTLSPTPDDVARPVSNISFENSSSQTKVIVTMRWEEPVSFYPIARYLVVLQDAYGNELQRRSVWTSSSSLDMEFGMPSMTLPLWQRLDLEPSVQYKVGIRSMTDTGFGSLSKWSQFTFADFTAPPLATPTPTVATPHPTVNPTRSPSRSPSTGPTDSPTPVPTARPTESPTASPMMSPTLSPSSSPTDIPSPTPTIMPSNVPTGNPTGPTLMTVSVTTSGWKKAGTTDSVFVEFKDKYGATSGEQLLFPGEIVTSSNTEFVSTLEFDFDSLVEPIDFDNLKFMYIWLDGNDKLQLYGSQIDVAVFGWAQYADNKRAGQKNQCDGSKKD